MARFYVLEVPENDGVVTAAAQDPAVTIDRVGPYFRISADGAIVSREWIHSAGATPFGFAFGRRGKLYVSEAQNGAAGGSTLSSYVTGDDGYPTVIGAQIPTFQTAACWVATSWDGKFAYTANAGSDTITGYRTFDGGQVSILTPNGVTGRMPAGAGALDLAAFERDRAGEDRTSVDAGMELAVLAARIDTGREIGE